MTADWARIPFDVLEKMSIGIVNEVNHVNRIGYYITINRLLRLSGNNIKLKTMKIKAICLHR